VTSAVFLCLLCSVWIELLTHLTLALLYTENLTNCGHSKVTFTFFVTIYTLSLRASLRDTVKLQDLLLSRKQDSVRSFPDIYLAFVFALKDDAMVCYFAFERSRFRNLVVLPPIQADTIQGLPHLILCPNSTIFVIQVRLPSHMTLSRSTFSC